MCHTVRLGGTKDWLLICTLKGSGLYRFDGGEYRSRVGDLTLFCPRAFQDFQICPERKEWDIFYAHFLPRAEWLEWLKWPELAPGTMVIHLREAALRHRIVRRFRDVAGYSRSREESFGLNALEEVLLWCDSVNPQQASSRIDPRVRKAMSFLSSHLAEPFSEERLARTAGLSPSRLRHLFRLQVGSSPRHYLEELRLRRAGDLLALSRRTIGEIAEEVGFMNPFYFTLRFKKYTGENPRAFRQRILRK